MPHNSNVRPRKSAMSHIRLAEPSDAAEIAELSRKAVEHGLPWSWTRTRVGAAIANPNTNVAISKLSGAVIGFGIMEYEDEVAHLVLFAVDAPDRRKGLGSELLAWLERVAVAAGISRVRVEARADNVAAIAFYRKHGYIQQAEVLGMYHGAEDGVRLAKQLTGNPPNAQ
jgi:[ribosomal protein S18]-alanine N-acetyltransferase